jgi:hypothetical protein
MKQLVICVVTLFAVGLFSNCLSAQDLKSLGEKVKHLERLSPVERDRLDRNIQSYRTLTSDQKAMYRQLYEELNKDRLQGGVLFNLLETYNQWLQTLSPTQRDQLQNESNEGRKIALIRQFMDEQDRQAKEEHDRLVKEEQEASRNSNNSNTINKSTNSESAFNIRQINPVRELRLDKRELEAVMRVIYDDLPADKRPKEFESVEPHEFPALIRESADLSINPEEWPSQPLLKKMSEKLPQKKVQIISTLAKWGFGEREIAVQIILGGVMRQAQETVIKPTENDRKATLEGLKPIERKNYDLAPDDKKIGFLNHKFLEKKGDASFLRMQETRQKVMELFEKLNVTPPPQFQRFSKKR